MARKADAYVDTSAFIAFADRSDSYHHLFVRAFAEPPHLITTSLVVAEGHGWFLRRFDSFRALHFLAMIQAIEPLEIVTIGEIEIDDAVAILRRYSDQALTLTDAAGLSLMKTRRIRSCWSTDRHLGLSGVPLLIHEP